MTGVTHRAPVSPVLPGPRPQVAMLVFPKMVLLDLVGPQTVLKLAQCDIHLVWKDRQPVPTDVGIPVLPTATFADCPAQPDVLFVPGGIAGTVDCMNDQAVLAFLADRGARARWVTSVCTGALVIGAAGLLAGYRATTYWPVVDLLPVLGATPVDDRVVIDRNRMTGGGVTAGIDFALALTAHLRGEEVARRVQLVLEYAPRPPFRSGTPHDADPELVRRIRADRADVDARARQAAQAAADSLRR